MEKDFVAAYGHQLTPANHHNMHKYFLDFFGEVYSFLKTDNKLIYETDVFSTISMDYIISLSNK
ncbi:MAG TPA: hypothetical protein DCG53_08335 [Syntrophus sp. (in: bacteria)]|nr:hypothetical protein [Syntrophus sp. (in: bacteria)]